MKNDKWLKSRLTSSLFRLIEFKTTKERIKELYSCLRFLKSELEKNNLYVRSFEKNGKPSLIALPDEQTGFHPEIFLHGHIDVVEGDEDQFEPRLKDGKIIGRGALDMKGGVSILIELMKTISEMEKKPSVGIMLTSDEEVGGTNGTRYLLKEKGFRPAFFLTAEGETDNLLKIKQKGVLHLKVSTKGKKAHSSYQWIGKNAIVFLIAALKKIETLFPERNSKDHWYSTVNIGTIRGGESTNTIPDYAEATLDIRYTEIDWKNSNQILEAIKKITKTTVKVEKLVDGNLMVTNKNNQYVKTLHKIAKDVLRTKKDLFFNNHGTNDARFAAGLGIPAVGFGPVGDNYHADEEYVKIQSLIDYYQILRKFLLQISS